MTGRRISLVSSWPKPAAKLTARACHGVRQHDFVHDALARRPASGRHATRANLQVTESAGASARGPRDSALTLPADTNTILYMTGLGSRMVTCLAAVGENAWRGLRIDGPEPRFVQGEMRPFAADQHDFVHAQPQPGASGRIGGAHRTTGLNTNALLFMSREGGA